MRRTREKRGVSPLFLLYGHQAEERGKACKGPLPGLYRRCGTLAERRPPGTETAVLQARSVEKS